MSVSPLSYVNRNHANDLPSDNGSVASRLALTLLPFLALYKPDQCQSLHNVMRIGTSITSGDTFDVALSVAAAVASSFSPIAGFITTSLHDIVLNNQRFFEAKAKKDPLEMGKEIAQLVSALFQMFAVISDKKSARIAAIGIQVLSHLITSASHFQKGRNIEGIGSFIFSQIRSFQLLQTACHIHEARQLINMLFRSDNVLEQAKLERQQLSEQIKNHKPVTVQDLFFHVMLVTKHAQLGLQIDKLSGVEFDAKKWLIFRPVQSC